MKNLALVTDAGTPGISDPGNKLIDMILDEVQVENSKYFVDKKDSSMIIQSNNIIPIPGPSAVITALSISGFPADKFLFLGFPPHKKGRQAFFKEIAESKYTIVFYESSHRIKKCLLELVKVLNEKQQLCIGRELTKKFETIYRGTIQEILKMNISEKGEFVVVVSK